MTSSLIASAMLRDPLYHIECLTAPSYTKYLISSRALPEPCMTLSSHTAPDVRPLLERLCLVHRLLLFPVGQWPRPNNAAPSLQPHYRAFDATTGCSAPAPGWSRLRLVPSRPRT